MANFVTIQMDIGGLGRMERIFPLMARQFEDMTPIWEDVSDALRVRLLETFEVEGPGWAGLAPMTRAIRVARGYGAAHPILEQSGLLKRSLTVRGARGSVLDMQPKAMVFGTDVPYARELHTGRTKGTRMPARPILQPAQLIPVIKRAISDHVAVAVRQVVR